MQWNCIAIAMHLLFFYLFYFTQVIIGPKNLYFGVSGVDELYDCKLYSVKQHNNSL